MSKRQRMVERQIASRGVGDALVLAAMARVRRELFVPAALAASAYDDAPLPIGEGQTISQPYVVALMIEALCLKGGERVLEVGAGSGYAAAVLGEIAGEVIAIERIVELAGLAKRNLECAGCGNVRVIRDDGTLGWAAEAPYDAILVSAGAPEIPEVLQQQLKIGGRLVLPVGAQRSSQTLLRVTRKSERTWDVEDLGPVQFVPLIGEGGWSEKA